MHPREITDEAILEIIRQLDEASVPQEGRFVWLAGEGWFRDGEYIEDINEL